MIDPIISLIILPGLIVGITVHEAAHAWAASLLGDDFPRRNGRVSLNPLKHLSPLGTLIIFVLPFGWGRPVVINPYNFAKPKRDFMLVSLAGPAANIITAAILLAIMFTTAKSYIFGTKLAPFMDFSHLMLQLIFYINLILAVVNLLPIPPLDGSRVLSWLIPTAKVSPKGLKNIIFLIIVIFLLCSKSLTPTIDYIITEVKKITPVSDSQKYSDLISQCDNLIDDKNYEVAIATADQAIKINPNLADAYCKKAYAFMWMDKYDLAQTNIQIALKIDPTDKTSLQYEKWMKNSPSKYYKAIEQCDELIEKENYRQAIVAADQAIKINPNVADAYCEKAYALIALGQDKLAIQNIRMALKIDPANKTALLYKKWIEHPDDDAEIDTQPSASQPASRPSAAK